MTTISSLSTKRSKQCWLNPTTGTLKFEKPTSTTLSYYRRFDSILESEIAMILAQAVGWENIEFQHYVCLQEGISPFPTSRWRCDMKYQHRLVEAKGFLTTEFLLQLRLMAQNNPIAFNNLVIVTNNNEVIEKLTGYVTVVSKNRFFKVVSAWKKE